MKKWASWAQKRHSRAEARPQDCFTLGVRTRSVQGQLSLVLSNLNCPGRQTLCLFFREVFLWFCSEEAVTMQLQLPQLSCSLSCRPGWPDLFTLASCLLPPLGLQVYTTTPSYVAFQTSKQGLHSQASLQAGSPLWELYLWHFGQPRAKLL